MASPIRKTSLGDFLKRKKEVSSPNEKEASSAVAAPIPVSQQHAQNRPLLFQSGKFKSAKRLPTAADDSKKSAVARTRELLVPPTPRQKVKKALRLFACVLFANAICLGQEKG